jgi:predicted secreted protein
MLLRLGSAAAIASSIPLALRAEEDTTGGDPLESMQWPGMRKQYLGDAPMHFSKEVVLKGPVFADDALNVPVFIDARALSSVGGGIERIDVVGVVFAERVPTTPHADLKNWLRSPLNFTELLRSGIPFTKNAPCLASCPSNRKSAFGLKPRPSG